MTTTRHKKLTRDETRLHNQRLMLKLIYREDAVSRADLARATGLTRTTASVVASELIQQGLVEEMGQGVSSGGKPPTLLRVIENARHIIGVDLSASELQGAVFDLRGRVVFRTSQPLEGNRGAEALDRVLALLDQLVVEASQPLLGIGVGLPGLIDASLGVVYHALNLGWPQLALGDILRQRYQVPIQLVNDSQAAALAEFIFANPEGVSDLATILVEQGISAGIVLNGQLYRGRMHSGASEIGHIRVEEDGTRCSCGHRGCLETVAGVNALLKGARAIYGEQPESALARSARSARSIDWPLLVEAYLAGDPATVDLVQRASTALGMVAASLTTVLNLSHVVLAGSVARLGSGVSDAVEREIKARTLPRLGKHVTVCASTLGDDSVELGAAAMLLASELGVV